MLNQSTLQIYCFRLNIFKWFFAREIYGVNVKRDIIKKPFKHHKKKQSTTRFKEQCILSSGANKTCYHFERSGKSERKWIRNGESKGKQPIGNQEAVVSQTGSKHQMRRWPNKAEEVWNGIKGLRKKKGRRIIY